MSNLKQNLLKTLDRIPWEWVLTAMCLIAGLLVLGNLAGCSSIGGGPSKGVSSSQVHEVQRDIPRLLKDLDEAGKLTAALTTENMPASKGAIGAKIEGVTDGIKALADRIATLEGSVQTLEADNKHLHARLDKENSANSQSLFWGSVGIIAVAALVIGAGIVLEQIKLKTAGALMTGYGLAGLVLWRIVLAIERIPDWFWWLAAAAGIAAVPAWYFLFHKPSVKKDEKWVLPPTPAAAGT